MILKTTKKLHLSIVISASMILNHSFNRDLCILSGLTLISVFVKLSFCRFEKTVRNGFVIKGARAVERATGNVPHDV